MTDSQFNKGMIALVLVAIGVVGLLTFNKSPDRKCKDLAVSYMTNVMKPTLEQGKMDTIRVTTEEVSYVTNEEKCYMHVTLTSDQGTISQVIKLDESSLDKSIVTATYVSPADLQRLVCSAGDPCMNLPAFKAATDRVFGR